MAQAKSRLIDSAELQGFRTEYDAVKEEAGQVSEKLGLVMKEIEARGYNKAAFKLVAKLLAGDMMKAQDFVRAFEIYSEVLGLNARLAQQPDLVDETDFGEEVA